MAWITALILLLVAALDLAAGNGEERPISLDLQDRNPLAWLLMAALCAFLIVFAKRLNKNGHKIRTVLLLLDVLGLTVISITDPYSSFHEGVLWVVSIFTIIWFTIMAVDYDCREIAYASAGCLVVIPVISVFSLGIAERALILYSLICSNILYYLCLNADGRRRW